MLIFVRHAQHGFSRYLPHSQTRESDMAKRSRKSKQVMEKYVEAVCAEAEGTTYEAGGFE